MYARLHSLEPESACTALERWAGGAPIRLLRVLATAGSAGALGVVLIDRSQWYVALGMMALAGLGAWGLLDHYRTGHPGGPGRRIESVVAVATVLSALVAILIGMFVFLGPAPHF